MSQPRTLTCPLTPEKYSTAPPIRHADRRKSRAATGAALHTALADQASSRGGVRQDLDQIRGVIEHGGPVTLVDLTLAQTMSPLFLGDHNVVVHHRHREP